MSGRKTFSIILILAVAPVVILSTLPVYFLIMGSLTTKWGAGEFSLSNFQRMLSDPDLYKILANTLIYGVGTAAVATFMGIVFSWIVMRLDIPGKRLFSALAVAALMSPMFIKAFGWVFLLSPRIGLINILFMNLFNTESPLFNIYGLLGMIFVNGVGTLPLTYLQISAAMNSMDLSLEDSSRIMGSNILKMLRKVTIPILRPAILSAFMLTFITAIEEFDYALIIGLPADTHTLSTKIYDLALRRVPPHMEEAAAYGLVYLLITFISLSIYIFSTKKAFRFVTVTGKPSQRTLIKLGTKSKIVAVFICLLFVSLSIGLPLGMVVMTSFMSCYTVINKNLVFTFTLSNYFNAFTLSAFWNAFTTSFIVSITVAIGCTFVGLFFSYAILRMKTGWTRFIEYFSMMPLAFPGIVYGLGLLWSFLVFPLLSNALYGTIYALIIGMLIIWLPFSIKMISGSLFQISNEIEDASYVCGASWPRTFWRIMIPLQKDGLINSFIYVFLNSFRALGAAILLVSPNFYMLATLLIDLYRSTGSASSLPLVMAISVIMTLILVALVMVIRIMPMLMRKIMHALKR